MSNEILGVQMFFTGDPEKPEKQTIYTIYSDGHAERLNSDGITTSVNKLRCLLPEEYVEVRELSKINAKGQGLTKTYCLELLSRNGDYRSVGGYLAFLEDGSFRVSRRVFKIGSKGLEKRVEKGKKIEPKYNPVPESTQSGIPPKKEKK